MNSIFIGFKYKGEVFGCVHENNLLLHQQAIGDHVINFYKNHSPKEIFDLFLHIKWKPFNEQTDAHAGSHLLSLLQEGNVDAYAIKLQGLFNQLTKDPLVEVENEKAGRNYDKDYKQYIEVNSNEKKAIFNNSSDYFYHKKVSVAYLIDLDEDMVTVYHFHEDSTESIKR